MKISDYFRKPISTFCSVQGVNTRVVVQANYYPPDRLGGEQAEAVNVHDLQGVSVMDSMYVDEVQALEDRLLAMARHDFDARREDARRFALEMSIDARAQLQAQRGVQIL